MTLHRGAVLGVVGPNGSGKSTLLKMLANVLERSAGSISWIVDNRPLTDEKLPAQLGYVAPYLQLYTEFTPREHVRLISDIRGLAHGPDRAIALMERLGLGRRMDDPLSSFSSGMMQRVRFVLALCHRPTFLFLDEPMTNLDQTGVRTIRALITEEREDRITVIATNDADDLRLCTHRLDLSTTQERRAEDKREDVVQRTEETGL